MRLASQENVMRILAGYNHWWHLKQVQREYLKPIKRTVFKEAMSMLLNENAPRSLYIIGPHRTGKTALLHQMVGSLIEQGIDPKRILYINIGHPFFSFISPVDVYRAYLENVSPYEMSRIFYFFDDIQLSPNQEKTISQLKKTFPEVTIVSSGTVLPEEPDKDTSVLYLPPMSFYEYCQIDAQDEHVGDAVMIPDKGIVGATSRELRLIARNVAPLRGKFMRYLYTGGFPKLIMEDDDVRVQRMIQESVVNETLLHDIPICFNIRGGLELEKVFLYLAFECPGIISFEALSRTIDSVTRPTVEKYINCLKKSSLIYLSNPADEEAGPRQKVQPKIYLADGAIRNAMLILNDVQVKQNAMKNIVETAVHRHLKFLGPDSTEAKIDYIRGKGPNKGLDMVLSEHKRLHIDIRYGYERALTKKDAIISMSDRADYCLIITKNDSEFGPIPGAPQNVFCIPAHIFLFLIGKAKAEGRSFLSGT